MNFLWPEALWLMPALLLLPALYVWLLRRRGKPALRYSDLQLVREASGRHWRRHVPPALLFVACAVLLFAAARPQAALTLPWARTTVMLAMDVSLSMRVSDVKPTRLAAAQEAAKLFLRDLPKGIDVGLVTFAGSAQVAQAATLDRGSLVSAIDAFQMQYGTAIGNAIVVCLAELFPDHGISLGDMTFGARQKARTGRDENTTAQPKTIAPVAPGSYQSAAILLLSDGRRTTGVDTLEAAKMAADRGVKVFTVGIGTKEGETIGFEGWSMRVRLDEETLKSIANITRADYFYAGTAADLKTVYQGLSSRLVVEKKETEISALFALAGALLTMLAAALSVWWFGRVA